MRQLIQIAALLVTMAAPAYAQFKFVYPWESPKQHCAHAATANSPDCIVDHWPDLDTTSERLAMLYHREFFFMLDAALNDAMASKKRFNDGDYPVRAVYWAFQKMMRSSEAHAEKIERWRKVTPDSHFIRFAQARLAYENAWRMRGGGYAGTVSNESWDLFGIRLSEARQILLDAPAAMRDSPIWHHLLLAIVNDSPRLSSEAPSVFAEATRRWPEYYDFYITMALRLVPRWGGSWQQVEGFITTWSRQRAPTEGASLYARLYSSVHFQGSPVRETLMDWKRMKGSFEDITARYPTPKYKNRYASYACLMKDKPAFESAMRKLASQDIDHDEWLQGNSYEACMRWAAI